MLSEEQKNIIEISKKLEKNNILRIQACAGSGKTTTLMEIAKANPDKKFLYLAFNKNIVEESKKKFPKNVDVKTTHSLAYKNIIFKMPKLTRVVGKYNLADFERYFGGMSYEEFKKKNSELETFLNSGEKSSSIYFEVLEAAKKGHMPYTHSLYLKEYSLLKDKGLDFYDYILLDEAQDTNLVTLDIFLNNQCRKILVGDTFQNIYSFRGTVINAMNLYFGQPTIEATLSYSFRVTEETINKVNYFLIKYRNNNDFKTPFKSFKKEEESDKRSSAMIFRTNSAIIDEIVDSMENNPDKYCLLKEPDSLLSLPINIFYLTNKKKEKISKEFNWLKRFSNIWEIKDYAIRVNDLELINSITRVEKYGKELFEIFDFAKEIFNKKENEVCLLNAHISKGMEFDEVTLGNDFPSLEKLKEELQKASNNGFIQKEEVEFLTERNLYYVAMTRAKGVLIDNTLNNEEYEDYKNHKNNIIIV